MSALLAIPGEEAVSVTLPVGGAVSVTLPVGGAVSLTLPGGAASVAVEGAVLLTVTVLQEGAGSLKVPAEIAVSPQPAHSSHWGNTFLQACWHFG
jgi:hypothetical protein